MRRITPLVPVVGASATGYALVVRGALTLDLGIGRRTRPLGPITLTIAAPPETVFDVIAAPYLGRKTHHHNRRDRSLPATAPCHIPSPPGTCPPRARDLRARELGTRDRVRV